MALYTSSVRLCATCALWSGSRVAANMGYSSKVENSENGTCNHKTKRGTQCKENFLCHFWEKWPALR